MEPIALWSGPAPLAVASESVDIPTITPYRAKGVANAPAILICPGGGYTHLADHEAGPVAEWLNGLGVTAFVLRYRLAPYRFPASLLDGQRAMRWIRYHADEFGVDRERIGVLGFSAGGHLAAMLARGEVLTPPDRDPSDPVDGESSDATLAILAYAVTIMHGPKAHGIVPNLFGPEPAEELTQYCSLPYLVSSQNPPTFLWHTADDQVVPVSHALQYADALSAFGVAYALHIFETGRHGLGLGTREPSVQAWTALCRDWLHQRGFIRGR